ncbi:MAG TPA: prepilin-type N-terminal cleavage/methylation domain-containing protein [Longimicrobiales bacterium]
MIRARSTAAGRCRVPARPGFTLVEVMLALTIGAMAISGATLLLLGLSDRGRAIDAVAGNIDREANAEHLLRTTVRNLELSRDATLSLEGGPSGARFRSWCDGPTGWPVRCDVRLVVREEADGRTLSLELRPDGTAEEAMVVDLWTGLHTVRILYLLDPGEGGKWTDWWTETLLPPAIGVVLDGDTLILPIRE